MIYFVLFLLFGFFIYISLRLAWWRKNISLKYPRILMYHMINEKLPNAKFNHLRVSPKNFEKQISWLSKNGFKSYFVREISQNMPLKSIIITFDDGYEDNFTNALPILQKYNFKATIFLTINRFEKNWSHERDSGKASDELNNEKMLSDEMVKHMLKTGLIEIGSHTLNHANLPLLSENEKVKELKESKEKIEKNFGINCESFAYPFGFFDENSKKIAMKFYKFILTTKNDVLHKNYETSEILRILISGHDSIFHFILKIKKGRCR